MSNFTPDITESAVFTALGGFLDAVFAGTTVVRGYDNGVSMPAGNFILISPLRIARLSTNEVSFSDTYDPAHPSLPDTGTASSKQHLSFSVQVEFWGTSATDWAITFSTLIRDDYAVRMFPSAVKPLYCDDPIEMAVTTGEQQYAQRYIVTTYLQYNPTVKTPMQFASHLSGTIIETETNASATINEII